jgi:hypothetical protein
MSTIPAAFVEQARQTAVEHLLADGTLRFAEMLVESEAGQRTLFAIDMPPPGDHWGLFQRMGIKFADAARDFGPIARASFASETWHVLVKPGEPPAMRDFSQDPRRQEALMVECWDPRAKEGEIFSYRMLRDSQGKLVDVVLASEDQPSRVIRSLLQAFCFSYEFARGRIPDLTKEQGHAER